ncbi:hypothetical protein PHYBLDRAFT_167235 [Phycomyces blakesleeanus NRRL 1555(-)]|uniref:Uncharacterized protein n=1 Tax=Phycomyces blakesleeanus (strain ATCC 8743b / DSM 1359 / FGSC 10004 / NBRC 33097 / NRRL 1555) TaxID=763407 RepID=A0A167N3V1_PHYB8|nr:hypothetical protein PHYBLDRAFT_167235 [Phycomyces blakesleeanus NRRL 1555(-)]OAD74900.1 hypothetical protein PHYBLDRAFT_167235 [Phycomyces blakesleeanus NRRL 1555(-)]|eukprot:XP_018292940.1 hypothetical protein PHYBLDRAFT_167235 [Phycomyces blakesleeanus NRRL 1555(-)]
MSTIAKLSYHECSICHKRYTNKKLVAKCEVQCLEKVYKEMNDTQSLQVASVFEQTHDKKDKYTNVSNCDIEHEDSMENDLAIMDVTENVIDDTSPQLVYDFSAPVPVSGYNNAKNLELMKIIKEFSISQKTYISLAKHFNEILSRSSEISYRACTPYLGTKLLFRFLGVDEETYHICCNGCMLYNNDQQTECPLQDQQEKPICCFKHFDEVASSSKKGLTGQYPFYLLDSFSDLFFFALDEMHTICHSIGKQVWRLVCSKYEKDHPLSLSLAAQKEIGTAIVSTRRSILTSFHSAWINVTRVHDQAAHKTLFDLVQTCNLLMSWELLAEEQTLIKT